MTVSALNPHRDLELLVCQARAGDTSAFDLLAEHYRPYLRAIAFVRTSRFDDAEDLAQQILLQVWRALPTLAEPSAFAMWLRRIAGNALYSWSRTKARKAPAAPLESVDDSRAPLTEQPLALILAYERQTYLRTALIELSDANRTALLMHVWGGYSHREIAETTGVAITTVEGRIYRAKRQLARKLLDRRLDLFANLIPINVIPEENPDAI